MEQIDLLWNLESQYNSLTSYEKELLSLSDKVITRRANRKIADAEKKLNACKLGQEETKQNLMELEKALKDHNFNFKELETSLYDGHSTDVKELEYLGSEKDKLQKVINEVETQILELMNEVDKNDHELLLLEDLLENIIDENIKLKETTKTLSEELEIKIEETKVSIEKSEDNIDKRFLTRYIQIKNNKGTGMAEVINFICGGCNIMIPMFAIDKLKNSKDVISCESCGRFLYYKKSSD